MAAKSRVAVGLDIGSTTVRCVVGGVDNMRLRLLAAAERPSAGWQKGRIADQEALAECLRKVVHEAEVQAKVSIEGVVVGVGGMHVQGLNSRGVYELGRLPREIGPEDLAFAVQLASKLNLAENRLLLQICPQDFTLDGRASYRNPRGLSGTRLEAHVHLVTASVHEHQSLVSAIHLAHLAVEETVYEPIAAAYACILPEDRSRGVALLDLGATSADLVIYEGDSLLSAVSLPISAEHFTKDLAYVLALAYDDAERLKIEYGCALLGLTADNTLVELPSHANRPARETPRRMLNEILQARAEELFSHAEENLRRTGMIGNLMEGLVLTGGGALLTGMPDIAERMLNSQCRIGMPVGMDGMPDEMHSPLWATAVGLCMYSGRLKVRKETRRRGPNIFGLGLG